jgi:hypothetical protein
MHTNAEASCLGSTATSYDPPPCKPSIRETSTGKDRGRQALDANPRFKSVLSDFAAAHRGAWPHARWAHRTACRRHPRKPQLRFGKHRFSLHTSSGSVLQSLRNDFVMSLSQ